MMKIVILQLFRFFSRYLYKLLGPNMSTKLSQTVFGKAVFSVILGNSRRESVYVGSNGIKLKLSRDEAISSGFIHLGVINPYETNIMRKVLKGGDTFIDVGAYVDGWHSIVAANIVGADGKVIAFEPVPEYCKKLSLNMSLNKLKNVTVEQLAISDKKGTRSFYIGGLASTFYKSHLASDKSLDKKVHVKTTSLDHYISSHKLTNIRLIKIDAEGGEYNVIMGAINLLKKKGAPDLIVEVADDYLKHGETSEKELLSLLKKLGYRPYSILENGLSKYVSKDKGRQLMNVYFSKKPASLLPLK